MAKAAPGKVTRPPASAWHAAHGRKSTAVAIPAVTKTRRQSRRILAALAEQHPGADTELDFADAYQLLVATILSAQCTDARVNLVTPALFKRYPDARALARASTAELEPQIQSTGFFRAKSRSLTGMAAALVETHGGEVPRTMEALVEPPGCRTQDRQRRARARARRTGPACRSPRAARRQPHRHRSIGRSGRGRGAARPRGCRRPTGPGRRTP